MYTLKKQIQTLLLTSLGVAALTGCAPSTYKVSAPAASEIQYMSFNEGKEAGIALEDKRAESDKIFSSGILKAGLLFEDTPIDPVSYLEKFTYAELESRGIKFDDNREKMAVSINKLFMKNHRSSAYSPFVTMTHLSADLKTDNGSERIVVFIKRGKVPVWSFDEIIEPTLNEPLSLLVKEFSAKINQHLYQHKITDTDVTILVNNIKSASDQNANYEKVYALGFGNNKTAIPALVEFSKSEDEYVRLAAISSLGVLKAVDQFDYLKGIVIDGKLWQDRAMALKAIGDFGTAQSKAFLEAAKSKLDTVENAKEREWSGALIGLYLD